MRAIDPAILEPDASIITARTGTPAMVTPGGGLQEPRVPFRAEQPRELPRAGTQVVRPNHLLRQDDGGRQVVAAADGVVSQSGDRGPVGSLGLVGIEARGRLDPARQDHLVTQLVV